MDVKQKFFVKIGEARVRIAPSPTGYFHIGTARTALFNYLFAKKYSGKFILRIEDTDLERSDIKFEKNIIDGLKWLGLNWDEGMEIGGDFAPYRQSERIAIYSKYIKKLLDDKKSFYCFHSKEELETEKNNQLKKKLPLKHECGHKNLKQIDINGLMARGDYIIRLDTPKKIIKFYDRIRGELEFDTALLGDISIAKELAIPLYNFAVVIDDFEMKITHVIRGEDHISNTPKQILIQEALGLPRLEYAHLPLILGPDKSKMSKRHGAISINDYRDEGYIPEAMINFMVLLGWNPGTNQEIFNLNELVEQFEIEKIQKSGAVFNIEKLNWINGYYIRNAYLPTLTKLCLPHFEKNDLIVKSEKELKNHKTDEIITVEKLQKIVALEQSRAKTLSEIAKNSKFIFEKKLDYEKSLLKWKKMTEKEILDSLSVSADLIRDIPNNKFHRENIEKKFIKKAEETKDKGCLLWPLRVALSGLKNSPGPFDIMDILGREKSLERVAAAIKLFK